MNLPDKYIIKLSNKNDIISVLNILKQNGSFTVNEQSTDFWIENMIGGYFFIENKNIDLFSLKSVAG